MARFVFYEKQTGRTCQHKGHHQENDANEGVHNQRKLIPTYPIQNTSSILSKHLNFNIKPAPEYFSIFRNTFRLLPGFLFCLAPDYGQIQKCIS